MHGAGSGNMVAVGFASMVDRENLVLAERKTKTTNYMKNILGISIVVVVTMYSALAAESIKEPNFTKGLSLDAYTAVSAVDLTGDVDYGGGLGVNYFFTRGFGAGVRATVWDDTGHFVDETSARLIARAPLWDRVSPYGYVEGTYSSSKCHFKDGDWGAGAGGGLEIAITRKIHLKGEAGLRVETDGTGSFIGTGGLSYGF